MLRHFSSAQSWTVAPKLLQQTPELASMIVSGETLESWQAKSILVTTTRKHGRLLYDHGKNVKHVRPTIKPTEPSPIGGPSCLVCEFESRQMDFGDQIVLEIPHENMRTCWRDFLTCPEGFGQQSYIQQLGGTRTEARAPDKAQGA